MAQSLFGRDGKIVLSIAEDLRKAEEAFLFLDFDGTIVPLRKTPSRAVLSGRMRNLLLRLARLRGTTLGIITGRSLADIRKHVNIPGMVLAANHGFEILLDTQEWVHPGAGRLAHRLTALTGALKQQLRHIPRAFVENKRVTLSVHYRNVSPARVDEVRKTVRAVVRRERLPVRITNGKKVMEVRPAASWGKGHALRKILTTLSRSRSRWMVYCGDDDTDEDAFRLLPASAVTIRVGKTRKTKARYSVRSVSDVYRFLTVVESMRREKRPSR
ncbi:MAG TPA: trehalose-phosphatase [Bacteroidota bacterium]|nr:trehalose-phosphatase [Bacteroidota bacterium]